MHARLLDVGAPPDLEIRHGIPSDLNARLRAGAVDVAPSSSIEYARNAERYRLIPDFTIASDGAVRSIVFESTRPLDALDGASIALTTASATSVVLLRALLEQRVGVRPRYTRFQQSDEADPLGAGADAALWIGDVALRRPAGAAPYRYDLGAEWKDWTGLPFVFALWQTPLGPTRDAELAELHARLRESLDYFRANAGTLAARHAEALRLPPDVLLDYWRQLRYELDEATLNGLSRFYEAARALSEVPAVPAFHWTPRGGH